MGLKVVTNEKETYNTDLKLKNVIYAQNKSQGCCKYKRPFIHMDISSKNVK